MNEFFHSIAKQRVIQAIDFSKQFNNKLGHRYLEGKIKEIALETIYAPFLSHQYGIGTGKLCNSRDTFISPEIDLIIYTKRLIPPFIIDEKLGIFPIETALTCIEVKTTLNKEEFRKTYNNFLTTKNNLITKLVTGKYNDDNEETPSNVLFPTFDLFAYDFKFGARKDPQEIFKMYQSIDSNWNTDPLIKNICVVGVGWWIHSKLYGHKGWYYTDSNDKNEVLGYLSSTINNLPTIEFSRGFPRVGEYVFDIKNTHLLHENGTS